MSHIITKYQIQYVIQNYYSYYFLITFKGLKFNIESF